MAPQKLFNIINTMRHFGVGQKVTRSIWHFPGTYWQITRVALKEGKPSHGKAWGVFFWRGQQKGGEQEIRGPLKKQWRLLEGGSEAGTAKPSPPQPQSASASASASA